MFCFLGRQENLKSCLYLLKHNGEWVNSSEMISFQISNSRRLSPFASDSFKDQADDLMGLAGMLGTVVKICRADCGLMHSFSALICSRMPFSSASSIQFDFICANSGQNEPDCTLQLPYSLSAWQWSLWVGGGKWSRIQWQQLRRHQSNPNISS